MEHAFLRMSAAGNAFFLSLDLDPAQGRHIARKLAGNCDGLILGSTSPISMRMFNPDGREAMCGNGLRCLARLLADAGAFESGGEIQTRDGAKRVTFHGDFVEAEMGEARSIDGLGSCPREFAELRIGDETFRGYGVFVGNPHWVLPANERLLGRVAELGPLFEKHERFPDGVNTEFVLRRQDELHVRVWERGAGETLSCGTGALAVAASGPQAIGPGQIRVVRYPGGALRVRSDERGILHLGGEVRREGEFVWREDAGLMKIDREQAHDPTG